MDLALALVKARQLMDKHGLTDWKLSLDRKKKTFGICSPLRKTITLSVPLVELNEEVEVTDTILHEIAHALDWKRNGISGHGYTWKCICIEVGAKPQQYFSAKNVVMEEYKYVLKNATTGRIAAKYYRLPSRGFSTTYNLHDATTGAIIKPTHILKNYITDRVITRYWTLPTKIRDQQHNLYETGKPHTKGNLKLYKVL